MRQIERRLNFFDFHLCVFLLSRHPFLIKINVSPISNTMLKLDDTWIKFIIIIIAIYERKGWLTAQAAQAHQENGI